MVCMLVLVSSKAHSTARGLSAVTLLHSISRFSLERERLSADGPLQNNKQGRSAFHGMLNGGLCGRTERCVPISVVLFERREGSQRVIELRGEGARISSKALT